MTHLHAAAALACVKCATCSRMLYGELLGRPEEFFISYMAAAESGQRDSSSAAAKRQQPQIPMHADLMSFKVRLCPFHHLML